MNFLVLCMAGAIIVSCYKIAASLPARYSYLLLPGSFSVAISAVAVHVPWKLFWQPFLLICTKLTLMFLVYFRLY